MRITLQDVTAAELHTLLIARQITVTRPATSARAVFTVTLEVGPGVKMHMKEQVVGGAGAVGDDLT